MIAPLSGGLRGQRAATTITSAASNRWVNAAVSAALISAAARPWGWGWLAWVAFVPLFCSLGRSRSPLMSAALGAVAALGFSSVAYEAAAALGAAWFTLTLLISVAPFAAACALGTWVTGRLYNRGSPAVHALFWLLAEHLPSLPELLGPWALPLATLGYTQADLPTIHLARYGSVTAVSGALLLANALTMQALAILTAGHRPGRLAAPLLGLLGVTGAAFLAWAAAPADAAGSFEVAVVQPNHPTALLAAASAVPEARKELLTGLSELADLLGDRAAEAPTLIVLPEAAWPGALDVGEPNAALSVEERSTLARFPRALIGAAGHRHNAGATNSAFLWQGGELQHVYAKHHLVPVGEAGLERGARPQPFPLRVSASQHLSVAPFICYDVAFPGTVLQAARAGAELLVVLTDDAFAALGDVPTQHLRLARFRAVESGLPLVFASNTGPSAVYGGNGSLLAHLGGGDGVLRASLGEGVHPTPYTLYGNWVGALAVILGTLLLGKAAKRATGGRGVNAAQAA